MLGSQLIFATSAVLMTIALGELPPDEIQVLPWKGKIKHLAVEEFPLPRDRKTFGIGEEVYFWIDPPGAEGANTIVVWYVVGDGTVYPVVGPHTIGKLDLVARNGGFTANSDLHKLGGKDEQKEPESAGKLHEWVLSQVDALPRGNAGPIASVPPVAVEYSQLIKDGLRRIDNMRKGKATAFQELDALGQKLLAQCSNSSERGQVYYYLAHVHAQSGLVHPDAVISNAKQALRCPLEPLQVPRLYVYWGDAEQVARAREAPDSRRKWSALPYLAGLADVLRYPVPEIAPDLPAVNAGAGNHAQQVEARSLAKFQVAMVQHRDTLVRQFASLYPTEPGLLDEIRTLASAVLRNARAEDSLLRSLRGGAWKN